MNDDRPRLRPGNRVSRGTRYHVYGLRVSRARGRAVSDDVAPWMADFKFRKGSPSRFARLRRALPPLSDTAPWVTALLPDGSRYLRWTGAFDFLIAADGRNIECHPLSPGSLKAFHTHLGPSISFRADQPRCLSHCTRRRSWSTAAPSR